VAPKAKPAGAVVRIQEIFGVNDAMRAISAWVADLGFIAVCPDLFWRPGERHRRPAGDRCCGSQAAWRERQGGHDGLLPRRAAVPG
jgi:dienelactone hydrolase